MRQYLQTAMTLFGLLFVAHIMLLPIWFGVGGVVGILGIPSWHDDSSKLFAVSAMLSLAGYCATNWLRIAIRSVDLRGDERPNSSVN